MKTKKFVTLKYKGEIETNDSIRWDCFYDFDKTEDVYPEEISIYGKNMSWSGNVDHIKIDDVIKILNKLKESGCNYIEIMHHCDHNSYVFNGIEVRESTPEEIHLEILKENKRKEKLRKIEEYERLIRELSSKED